jgi:hypothetical protein
MRPGAIASSAANCSATTSGRVVREHDAAGSDPDALGARCRAATSTEGVVDATAGMLWCSANQ